MSPKMTRGGPPPGDRPAKSAPATAAKPKEEGITVMPIVRQQGPAGQRLQSPATCRVSLLVPSGRRTRWWYLATCPTCHRPHLGRARELAGVTGTRKLPCSHLVTVVIARTYGAAA